MLSLQYWSAAWRFVLFSFILRSSTAIVSNFRNWIFIGNTCLCSGYELEGPTSNPAYPRTIDWPLISSPLPLILLLSSYNLFVLKIGPILMQSRKPFDVRLPMALYNILQVIFNGFFFEEGLRLVWFTGRYSWVCEEVDYSYDPLAVLIANFCWYFMLTKVLDLLDTVFMVLRKKQEQISFLHVYHHSCMVFATWMATRYVPGGHGVFFATVNSFVHVVMYSYYFVTAINPEFKKNLAWKRRITEIQLIQFVITIAHGSIALLNNRCNFPKSLLALFIPQDVFMLALFWDFYQKAYLTKREQKVKNDADLEPKRNEKISNVNFAKGNINNDKNK